MVIAQSRKQSQAVPLPIQTGPGHIPTPQPCSMLKSLRIRRTSSKYIHPSRDSYSPYTCTQALPYRIHILPARRAVCVPRTAWRGLLSRSTEVTELVRGLSQSSLGASDVSTPGHAAPDPFILLNGTPDLTSAAFT